MAARRDIGPLLQRLRAFLLGREHTIALRFEDSISERSQPPPNVPGGPAHIISANSYCKRDPRREVQPPTNVGVQKMIAAESNKNKSIKLPTPGPLYQWD